MYAVIKVGGNQYRVSAGETILVDKQVGKVGDILSFTALLFVDGNEIKVGKAAEDVPVHAKIIAHEQGEKIDIYRFRAKSRYRRHIGFRADVTRLEIASVGDKKPQVAREKHSKLKKASVSVKRKTKEKVA